MGRLRPGRAAQPADPDLGHDRRPVRAAAAGGCRAGSAAAAAGGRAASWIPSSSPMPMPITSSASTTSARSTASSARRSTPMARGPRCRSWMIVSTTPSSARAAFFYRPALEPKRVAYGEHFEAAGLPVEVFRQDHGVMDTLGLRVGRFAYSTDVVKLPEESLAGAGGAGHLGGRLLPARAAQGACQPGPGAGMGGAAGPRRTVLTHMGPAHGLPEPAARPAAGDRAGLDGMVLEVPSG